MVFIKKQFTKTSVYKVAKNRLDELISIQAIIENSLSAMPPGKIHICKKAVGVQFYLRNEPSDIGGVYLSKKQPSKIAKYLQKTYEEKLLKLIIKERKQLELFLTKSEQIPLEVQYLYSNEDPEIKKLIDPYDVSDEDFVAAWEMATFAPKIIGDNVPEYITDKGERVRSKSELAIANTLYKLKIPYKYECPLKLSNGIIIYPDFTVLNIVERKILYWEHRGMMDDRTYVNHAITRVKDYRSSGIILGRNLIITEETATTPLGTSDIMNVISAYFR